MLKVFVLLRDDESFRYLIIGPLFHFRNVSNYV